MAYPPRKHEEFRVLQPQGHVSETTGHKSVIENVDLDLVAGELVSIIGPSGAGKTTLLRILAGLEKRFQGSVRLDGLLLMKPNRKVQLVFQENRLFPWFNVEQNLRFASDRNPEGAGSTDFSTLLSTTGLVDLRGAWPKDMSGGEQTRVAFARAMMSSPMLLLLDEPFRALDQVTKEVLQDYLLNLLQQRQGNMSVLMVSHSISDAVFLSDRVLVVRGSPLGLYKEFRMPKVRTRRDQSLSQAETDILSALRDVYPGSLSISLAS
jgi:sulfonate transport system ATP-binding protein